MSEKEKDKPLTSTTGRNNVWDAPKTKFEETPFVSGIERRQEAEKREAPRNVNVVPLKPLEENANESGKVEEAPKERLTMTEMVQMLGGNPTMTPEQEEQERKREKREKLFASISDGISALSNLYFTTKGAPNMYNPAVSQSAEVNRKWQKALEDRQGQMQAYVRNMMAAKNADDDYDKQMRAGAMKEREIKIKERDQDRKQQIADAQVGKYKAQQNKDTAMVAYYEAKTQAIMDGLPLDLAIKGAQEAYYRAKTGEANRRGTSSWVGGSGGSGGRSGGKYSLFNPETGNTEYFSTLSAQQQRAGELGYNMSPGTSVSTTTTTNYGDKKTTTTQKGANASGNLGAQERQKKAEFKKMQEQKRVQPASKQALKPKQAQKKEVKKEGWAKGLKL